MIRIYPSYETIAAQSDDYPFIEVYQFSNAGLCQFTGADDTACPNVLVLPDGNDLEAQLIADGYLDAIETAANLMDNPGALDRYITAQHGKLGPTVMGVQPVRDYMSAGGRPRAALDMISSRKTRYAAPIALAITSLPDAGRRIPPKVGEFLGIISADLNITRPAVAGGDAE